MKPFHGRVALVTVAAALLACTTGCGYLMNIRDDFLDCGTIAVGIVPPVAPLAPPWAAGALPPAFGIYAQATEFLHLGAMIKATGDLEWDRRGLSATVDVRRKIGIGPFHDVYIKQRPALANPYKLEGNELDGWRDHMDALRDPLFDSPAKTLIFEPTKDHWLASLGDSDFEWEALPWMSHGWQDWEMFSLEIAIPEPFILHTGVYARVGIDPSQIFDLALSLFGIDLYGDAAYKFFGGVKHEAAGP